MTNRERHPSSLKLQRAQPRSSPEFRPLINEGELEQLSFLVGKEIIPKSFLVWKETFDYLKKYDRLFP